MNVSQSYSEEVQPIKIDKKWQRTRAEKETRYAHFNVHKQTSIQEKERWSIDLIKEALRRSKKPVVSCSFGIDSILDIYLTRKALVELGRDPSDIDIVWNDTANEFKEVRRFQKELTEKWNLRLTITKPKKTLKHIIDGNGGITDDYFTARKGDRRHGRPLSEKCCGTLKHEPMKRIMKEKDWDLLIVGLRADESGQRLQAGLRDGEFFYSISEWKAFVCRPILWWKEKDVWEYVEQENIPYNDLYKMNLIQEYPKKIDQIVTDNMELLVMNDFDIKDLREQQIESVNRKQAMILKQLGFKMFNPRTGCMMCPIPVKYGYMQWMRLNHEKVYNAMVYNLGYGNALINMVPKEVREEIEYILGIKLTPENAHLYLKDILDAKPCTFDKF